MQHTSNPASSDLVSIQDLIISKLEQNPLDLKYSFSLLQGNIMNKFELDPISTFARQFYLAHGVQEPIHQIL